MIPCRPNGTTHALAPAGVRLLAFLFALALAPSPAIAGNLEVGGWLSATHASEVTHVELCNARGCFPGQVFPGTGRLAPSGAFNIRAPVLSRLAIRGDLAVVPKGYSLPTQPYVRSTYIEAPLLAEFSFLPTTPVDLTALVGIAPALRATCYVKGNTVDGVLTTGCGEPRHGRITGPRLLDLGAVLGLGLRLDAGAGTLFAEWRHVHGIVDSNPHETGTTYNITHAFLMGYMVRLGDRPAPEKRNSPPDGNIAE